MLSRRKYIEKTVIATIVEGRLRFSQLVTLTFRYGAWNFYVYEKFNTSMNNVNIIEISFILMFQ